MAAADGVAARKPLGLVTESVLNSPQREQKRKGLQKTPIKSGIASQKANITLEIYSETPNVDVEVSSEKHSHRTVRSSGKNISEVVFPPGAMGLDLEPLISSVAPDRLIGCRIKDFYFGMDHNGIDEMLLRSLVVPGDIISTINGQEVLFAQFSDILDMLRKLKPSHRTICFKKISAEEADGYKTRNSTPTIQSADPSRRSGTPVRARRIDGSQLTPAIEISQKNSNTPLAKELNSNGTSKRISQIPKDVSLLISPREVKQISRIGSTGGPSVATPNIDSPQKIISSFISASNEEVSVARLKDRNQSGVCETQPMGCEGDDGISVGSLHSFNNEDTARTQVNTSAIGPLLGSSSRYHSELSSKLVHVGAVIGNSVVSAASVVGYSAERIIDTAIPLYSAHQMEDVIEKKHCLLRELSQTCMLLGLSEQRQSTLETQIQRLRLAEQRAEETRRQTEDRYRLTCARYEDASIQLATVQADRDAWCARAHAAEMEIADLRSELRGGQSRIGYLQSELDVSTSQKQSLQQSIEQLEQALIEAKQETRSVYQSLSEARDDLDAEKDAHATDIDVWQAQFDRMQEEQRQLSEELEATLREASQRFASMEEEKDSISKEKDTLLTQLERARGCHANEVKNLKENIIAQQEWQRERLKERELELASLRSELEASSQRDLASSAQLAADQLEIEELKALNNTSQNEIAILTRSIRTIETKLKGLSDEKKDALLQSNGRYESELKQKKEDIVKLSTDFDDAIRSLNKQFSERADLQRQKDQVETKCADFAKQIASARDEASATTEQWKQVVAVLKIQLEEREQEFKLNLFKADLSSKLAKEAATYERNELSTQLKHLEGTNAALKNEVDKLKADLSSAHKELRDSQSIHESIASQLKMNLQTFEDNSSALEEKLSASQSEIISLRSKMSIAENHLTDLQLLLNRSNDQSTLLRSKLQSSECEVAALKKDMLELKDQCIGLKKTNDDLVSSNQQLEQGRVALCEKFEAEQVNNIAALKNEIESSMNEVFDLTEIVRQEKTHSAFLKKTIEEKDSAIKRLDDQVKNNMAMYELELSEMTKNRDSLMDRTYALTEESKKLSLKLVEADSEIWNLKESLNSSGRELEQSKSTIHILEERISCIDPLESALRSREENVRVQSDRVVQLTRELTAARSAQEDLEATISTANAYADELGKEIEYLRTTAAEQRSKIKSLTESESELKMSLEQSSLKIDTLATDLQCEADAHNLLQTTIRSEKLFHSATLQELEATKEVNISLNEEVAAHKESIAALQATLAYRQDILVSREDELDMVRKELDRFLSMQREKTDEFSNENKINRDIIRDCYLVLSRLSEKLTDIITTLSSEEVSKDLYGEFVSDAENCFDETKSVSSVLSSLISKLQMIDHYTSQVTESVIKTDKKLIDMRDAFEEQGEMHKISESSLKNEIQQLTIECEDKNRRLAGLNLSIASLSEENNRLMKELSRLRSECTTADMKKLKLRNLLNRCVSKMREDLLDIRRSSLQVLETSRDDMLAIIASSSNNFMDKVSSVVSSEKQIRQELLAFQREVYAQNVDSISKLEMYDGAVDTLEKENFELLKKCQQAEHRAAMMDSVHAELSRERKSFSVLQKEFRDLTEAFQSEKLNSKELSERLSIWKEEQRSLRQSMEISVEEARADRATLVTKLTNLESQCRKYEIELSELKQKAVGKQEKDFEELQETCKALKKQLNQIEMERDVAMESMETMRLDMEKREVLLKKEMESALEGYRVDRALLIHSFDRNDASSKHQSLEFQEKEKKLLNELTRGQNEVEMMRQLKLVIRENVSALESERTALQHKFDKLLSEHKSTTSSLREEMASALEGYRTDRSLLVGRYEEQIRDLAKTKDVDFKCMEQNISELHERIKILSEENRRMDSNLAATTKSAQVSKKEISDIKSFYQSEIESLTGIIQSLKDDIECDKDEFEAAKKDFFLERNELNSVISQLQTELRDLSNSKFSVEEELALASARMHDLESELNTAKSRSRRGISEAAKTKKELDLALVELQRVTEAYDMLKKGSEKLDHGSKAMSIKLEESNRKVYALQQRVTGLETMVKEVRDLLDSSNQEKEMTKAELVAFRNVMEMKESELMAVTVDLEKTTADLESTRTLLVTTESKLLVALSNSEEFSNKFVLSDLLIREKEHLGTKICDLVKVVEEQEKALEAASARELEFTNNRNIFQKIAMDADAQAKKFGDQVIELSRLLASSQGEILHLKSQLRDKKKELKALNEAVTTLLTEETNQKEHSDKNKRNSKISTKLSMLDRNGIESTPSVQHMRWRDDLWTQALDIQSSVTDVATLVDDIAPVLDQYMKFQISMASTTNQLSPTDSTEVPRTRMRANAAIKNHTKVSDQQSIRKHRVDVPSINTLNLSVQRVMDQLHEFQSSLLSPPWNDMTVADATIEIREANIVSLKEAQKLHHHHEKRESSSCIVMRVIIRMLLRVIRRRKMDNVLTSTSSSAFQFPIDVVNFEANHRPMTERVQVDSVKGDRISIVSRSYDTINESNASSIWNVSDESDDGAEYSLEELVGDVSG